MSQEKFSNSSRTVFEDECRRHLSASEKSHITTRMLPDGNQPEVVDAIKRIAGDAPFRVASAEDAVDGIAPKCVIEPTTVEQVANVLKAADGAGLRVIARGGGTKLDWGNPPRGLDIVLSLKALNCIIEHASADMTATVQAGCTVATFAEQLLLCGQRLAVDVLWPARATIGGILATDDSGALRGAFGSLRDHLIGITVVLADGTIARSGGKVVKNVAGYDLPKLFIGSLGTLGVIVEATFRLYPIAKATRTMRFTASTNDALAQLLAAFSECSLLTSAVQFEASGGPASVLVLIESLPESVDAKTGRVVDAAMQSGAAAGDAGKDPWHAREQLFDQCDEHSCIGKVSLMPTQWPGFIHRLGRFAERYRLYWSVVAQAVGVGFVRLGAADAASLVSALNMLRTEILTHGGTFVLHRCPLEVKRQIDAFGEAGNALPLMREVKRQFDPNAILSPGRFVGGI